MPVQCGAGMELQPEHHLGGSGTPLCWGGDPGMSCLCSTWWAVLVPVLAMANSQGGALGMRLPPPSAPKGDLPSSSLCLFLLQPGEAMQAFGWGHHQRRV